MLRMYLSDFISAETWPGSMEAKISKTFSWNYRRRLSRMQRGMIMRVTNPINPAWIPIDSFSLSATAWSMKAER